MLVFVWDGANVDHIGKHDVTPGEAEYVVARAKAPFPRATAGGRHTGKFVVWGPADDGRLLQVIFVYPPDEAVDIESLPTDALIAFSDGDATIVRVIHRPRDPRRGPHRPAEIAVPQVERTAMSKLSGTKPTTRATQRTRGPGRRNTVKPGPAAKRHQKDMDVEAKEFEALDFKDTRPLSAGERATWDKATRDGVVRRGRPKVGEGSVAVLVTMERGLLQRADRFARARGFKRSELVARGLELAMRQSP